jgi:hypothetical protein
MERESQAQSCISACDQDYLVKEGLGWWKRWVGVFVVVEDERVEGHFEMALDGDVR